MKKKENEVIVKIDGVTCVAITDKALKVEIDNFEAFLPKSLLKSTNLVNVGDKGFIELPEWLAKERGLL